MSGKDNSLSSWITTNRSHASLKSYSYPVTNDKTPGTTPIRVYGFISACIVFDGICSRGIQQFQIKPTGTVVVIPFCSSLLTGYFPVEAFPSIKGRKNKDA